MKPEKARGVEDLLLRSAQMGQIMEKVFEFVFTPIFDFNERHSVSAKAVLFFRLVRKD